MLTHRSLTEEQMDDPNLPPHIYAQVLKDLARVNTVTLARRPTLDFLGRLKPPSRSLKILDVGFGNGDMLRRIAQFASKRAWPVDLTGVDLNPKSREVARSQTPPSMAIRYLTGDYADLAGQDWDVILSSLVAHHMTHDQLVAFLRFMDAEAKCGWFINDLHRHDVAWLGYPLLARLMGSHPIVRQDGQLSIARAFRPDEWAPILEEAGIPHARVFRAFPFRLCVEQIR
jgi:2-polyprenyl-3-methyl-5-hydroxy-6-metoxy-1,4-benzoquinol methylase